MANDMGDRLMFFAAGCSIGIAAGMLLASRAGQEMRNTIAEKVRSSGIGEAASEKLQNVIEKGKNVASIGRKRINTSIDAGRRVYSESIEGEDVASR